MLTRAILSLLMTSSPNPRRVVGVNDKSGLSDVSFYYDLMQFHVPAGSVGATVCGYAEGTMGHVGVGRLTIEVVGLEGIAFNADQLIRTVRWCAVFCVLL